MWKWSFALHPLQRKIPPQEKEAQVRGNPKLECQLWANIFWRPKQKGTTNLTTNHSPTQFTIWEGRRVFAKKWLPTMAQKMANLSKKKPKTWIPNSNANCVLKFHFFGALRKRKEAISLPPSGRKKWEAQVNLTAIYGPKTAKTEVKTWNRPSFRLCATRNGRPHWKETQNLNAAYAP